MKITTQMLTKRKACAAQVALFEKLFGAEAEVTPANCLKAVAARLNIDWAAENLLSPERLQAYDAAMAVPRQAYWAAKADAEQAYWAATAEARQAYDAAKADAARAYDAATAEAFYHAATEDTE